MKASACCRWRLCNVAAPAIVSDHDVLVEVGGDATLRRKMNDVDSLAAAMKATHDDPALRLRVQEAGLAHSRRFTWERTARILLDLCPEVGARKK